MSVAQISKSSRARTLLAAAAVAAGVAGVVGSPSTAQARHHLHIDLVVPVAPVYVPVYTPGYPAPDDCPPPAPPVVEQPQPVWVEPVYRTACDRQWVAPTVQTTVARVWCPPVTQTVNRPVYVPDQYGYQTVAVYDRWGRTHFVQQQVLLTPAHTEDRCDTVVVAPGHFEDRPQQQVVCPGHWASVERQELVCAGHWETRTVAVATDCPPPQPAEIRVRLPF